MATLKDTYHHETEMRLKKIRVQITELELRVDRAETGVKARHDQKMTQIRGQFAQATEKLSELKKAPQDLWTDLKNGVDETINVLSEAVDTISQHIKTQPED